MDKRRPFIPRSPQIEECQHKRLRVDQANDQTNNQTVSQLNSPSSSHADHESKDNADQPTNPSIGNSSPSPPIIQSLFGQSPLHALLAPYLPPVLSSLVLDYTLSLIPNRRLYAGHAYIENNAYFKYSNAWRVEPNRPVQQTLKQSIDVSLVEASKSSTDRSIDQSIDQSANTESIRQTPSPSFDQSINQSINPTIGLRPPLRLDHRSFSWSCWLNRASLDDNQFVFSFSNPHVHLPPVLGHLHVGYRHYSVRSTASQPINQNSRPVNPVNRPPNQAINQTNNQPNNQFKHVDCFTFGFWCNDLDHKEALHVQSINQWEHWAGTFEYPIAHLNMLEPFDQSISQSSDPSNAQSEDSPDNQSNNQTNSQLFDQSLNPAMFLTPALGRRRLYRNGIQVASDECPAFIGTDCELAIGNRLVHSTARESVKGSLSDFRIWSRMLPDFEIKSIFEGNEKNVRKQNLEVWYKFDESEEGFPVDQSINQSISSSSNMSKSNAYPYGDNQSINLFMSEDRGRLLIDHSGHGRHASLILPDDIRMMQHSLTITDSELFPWEGRPH